jgi:CMP-N,N'-diacetyllegionaminic acid synthase
MRVAVIPARAGSKSVPRKNLALLGGRPLLEYTVVAAAESGCFDRVILSSEDGEIRAAGLAAGAEVLERPEDLAGDEAKSVQVVAQVLESIGWKEGDRVALLPVTSPLRNAADIRGALGLLSENPLALSVVSLSEYEFPPAYAVSVEDGYLVPVFPEHYAAGRSQRTEVPLHYRPNGAIYAAGTAAFMAGRSFFTERTLAYLMPPERSIDIDRPIDLVIAGALLGKRVGLEG